MQTANIQLLLAQPFFGNVAIMLRRTPAPWCRSLATDGIHLYFNPSWVSRQRLGQLVFGIAHEAGHCMLEHFLRLDDRDVTYWNLAGDYWINDYLISQGIGEVPEGGAQHSKKYDHRHWTTAGIFDDLVRTAANVESGFDDHLHAADTAPEPGVADVAEAAGHPAPDGVTRAAVLDNLRSILLQAQTTVTPAEVPGFVDRTIGELVTPRIDWRDLLRGFLVSSRRGARSYARPSRRRIPGILLPGRDRVPLLRATVAIDASSSTSTTMGRDFVSETLGMMQGAADFELTVFSFDTQVYNVQTFTPASREAIYAYVPRGGGATRFECIFAWLEANRSVPPRLVVFTDGLPNAGWGNPLYCETLFAIHSHPEITAPFGATLHIR